MESKKLEKIRAQTAATAAKKLSAKEFEREQSRLRLEEDRVTSQQNQQQKQQQRSIPPSTQCQELWQKQQNHEQQAQRNQVIHQQTQEQIRKHKQHLKAKHDKEQEQLQIDVNKQKAINVLQRTHQRTSQKCHRATKRTATTSKRTSWWIQTTDRVGNRWHNHPVTHFVK